MGWLFVIGFGAVTLALLWKVGKLPRQAMELSGAAALLAVAGYALQGKPGQPGSPVEAPEQTASDAAAQAAALKSRPGMSAENQWQELADALIRVGNTRAAVSILNEASHKSQNNPDVWVSLGNALVVHNQGQMSPAAQYAFEKAAEIAPAHPGPPFFLGLTLAQAGKFDEAADVWRKLLASTPADAPWKEQLTAEITSRMAQIGQPMTAPAATPQTEGSAPPPPPDAGSPPPPR